ncbi:MAG: 6-pyruvoyl trahydropterin synthase family protein [Candidatus Rokuibacteriota bacterium]
MSPGRVEVTRVYHFSAAHQLQSPALTRAENTTLYGPCARVHGHNYYLEVTLAGTPHSGTGMAVDLGEVDAAVHRVLIDVVDHQTLEGVPTLAGVITTGENLARTFWTVLAPVLPAETLTRVVVQETAKNRFEYRGEGA